MAAKGQIFELKMTLTDSTNRTDTPHLYETHFDSFATLSGPVASSF